MDSNLNIKYGNKTGTGNILKISNEAGHEGEEAVSVTPGTIYAAENTVGEIEMYIDTPKTSGSERKRLDPRIYVGSVNDLIGDTTELTQEVIDQRKATATSNIWSNYDVWIDTSGDPTGIATSLSDGLMSATQAAALTDAKTDITDIKNKIDGLITALQKLNIKITSDTTHIGNTNTLTVLMPSTWVHDDIDFNPDGGVTKFNTSGGNGS